MKELSKFEIAAIRRTAQNVNAMVTKKTKLKEKIDALQAEYDQIEEAQEQFEVPIRKMTGDDRAVERKPVESFMLKKVTVGLFRKTSIPTKLEEVYTIRDGHE